MEQHQPAPDPEGPRPTPCPRLAVLASFTGDGGVENMVTNLLRGFVAAGVPVDLILLKARGGHLDRIPPQVDVIRLNVSTSALALPAVARYLRRHRPAAMLVAKDRASRIALLARRIAGVETRLVLRMGMHLSGSLAGKNVIRRWSRYLPVRWLYPWADRIIAVSQAVADDLATIGHIPRERFVVIRNPSVPEDIDALARAPVDHPWLGDDATVPVIMGIGRLTAQKDFPSLIRAFSEVRRHRPARLIILGAGPQREALEKLAATLRIGDCVYFAGFQGNPYAWLSRASLFVLSSRYEGSPNVLVEAMALGVPVVSTNCPSGPAEILDNGRIAPLVPPGDSRALAEAMQRTLDQPSDRGALQHAVSEYTIDASAREYLRVLGYSSKEDGTHHR